MASRSAELTLVDLSRELLEKARAAKNDAVRSKSGYDKGRQFAFYEAVSLLVQQAEAFGIDPADVGLQGVDPERDLLGP